MTLSLHHYSTNPNMPKADHLGWENAEVPAICDECLGSSEYLRMTREKHGAECKLCTRPFTVFKWKPDRRSPPKRSVICQTCARQKNACQSCMLDLTYRIPISVRDAALAMVKDGTSQPSSNVITKQYIAQNFERKHEGEVLAGASKELESPLNPKAVALLEHIANTRYKPYTRTETSRKAQEEPKPNTTDTSQIKRLLSKLPLTTTLATQAIPTDQSITSFYIMGIEEDLPDYAIQEYFEQFGAVKSVTIVRLACSGFVVMGSRAEAEKACQHLKPLMKNGYFVISGVRLKAAWSKPRPLGSTSTEQVKIGQVVRKLLT